VASPVLSSGRLPSLSLLTSLDIALFTRGAVQQRLRLLLIEATLILRLLILLIVR
jgi:hypothetical protein